MIPNLKKIACFVILSLFSFSSFAANRLALVIGNDNDANAILSLSSPHKSANRIAATLQKMGFSVMIKSSLNEMQFNDAIDEFVASLGKDDIAFIYYAGHGVVLDATGNNLQSEAINTQIKHTFNKFTD